MKKFILLSLFLVSFSRTSLAEDYFLVEKPDGSVAIIIQLDGSRKPLETVMKDNGFGGYLISRIQLSDLPEGRKDRKYWKKNDVPIGKKVIIDTAKKQADEIAQNAKEERKRALLKMTPDEYREAKDLGLVR